MKTNITQLSKQEIYLFMEKLGQKPYRADQVIRWVYKKMATSFDEMTDLSKDFREKLKETAFIGTLNILRRHVSIDGTHKFLFQLKDGETIESVLIPNSTGQSHFTLCISSQVGCAVGCTFCMTGTLGLKRNLKAHEIVGQVIAVKKYLTQAPIASSPPPLVRGCKGGVISNIVFMGMGEPLNNFNELVHALSTFTGLMGFSRRRITVSTAGIIPGIQRLAEIGPMVNLAISLNATTDETRSSIMPVNKKYPLKKLLKACHEFPLPPNRSITFEYVLLGGLNDTKDDALRLVKLLKGIKAKINLIPYNPVNSSEELKQPLEGSIEEFQNVLKKAGMTVIIRRSMGADISAACGQLKAAYQ